MIHIYKIEILNLELFNKVCILSNLDGRFIWERIYSFIIDNFENVVVKSKDPFVFISTTIKTESLTCISDSYGVGIKEVPLNYIIKQNIEDEFEKKYLLVVKKIDRDCFLSITPMIEDFQ